MSGHLAIIGLGQIGASIGLALKEHKKSIQLVGYDKDKGVAAAAHAMQAVDDISSLRGAVKEAAIVLICLPLGELR